MTAFLLLAALAPGNLVPNGDFEQAADNGLPREWVSLAPREETMPHVLRDGRAGVAGSAAVAMVGIGPRTFGAWRVEVPGVAGETWYRVGASYRVEQIDRPGESLRVMLVWHSADGTALRADYVCRRRVVAHWTQLEDTFQAPAGATSVSVSLSLRWTAGTVWWDDVSVAVTDPPPTREVKLGTVCFTPRGTTPEENRTLWAEQAARAGELGADLVCLGEGITVVGTGKRYVEVAEPVPGPTTKALGEVAAAHRMYIVAGLYEVDEKTVYNTAVLIDRDGQVAGKYRKTHLPESEASAGLTPGDAYPVFYTDFGTIGIQICYDDFFPECSRALALNGAEVILTPIWGDGRYGGAAWDVLPRARAIDNGVWFVASNYSQKRSLIVNPWGELLGDTAGEQGVVVVEVDLNEKRRQPWLSIRPGGYWRELYPAERRPGTYGDLTR